MKADATFDHVVIGGGSAGCVLASRPRCWPRGNVPVVMIAEKAADVIKGARS